LFGKSRVKTVELADAAEWPVACCSLHRQRQSRGHTMRGVLLWAVGVPIPVIILLYVFHVI
jgi:hypothetical protein